MRILVETYKIVCDGCGETFRNDEGFACYVDYPNKIENDARESEWLITEDGHHYCEDCHRLNEKGEWKTKDGKLYDIDSLMPIFPTNLKQ